MQKLRPKQHVSALLSDSFTPVVPGGASSVENSDAVAEIRRSPVFIVDRDVIHAFVFLLRNDACSLRPPIG